MKDKYLKQIKDKVILLKDDHNLGCHGYDDVNINIFKINTDLYGTDIDIRLNSEQFQSITILLNYNYLFLYLPSNKLNNIT